MLAGPNERLKVLLDFQDFYHGQGYAEGDDLLMELRCALEEGQA